MTLTYNPNLAKVKVNLHTKYQGRRSNGSAVRAQTEGHPNGRTDATKYIRAHSLYFTVDDSSDELKSGSTRKKTDHSAFFLFSPPT